MKKRICSTLLALMLCTAALCMGASAEETGGTAGETCEQGCIAHAVWSPYIGYPDWETTHIKTLDELREKITDGRTWVDYKNGDTATVTFLKDVKVDKTFAINKCYAHIVLDLKGHTISGSDELGGGTVIDATYGFLAGACVAIQNGTVESTAESGTALMLSDGAVTLENVTVKGDTVLDYQYTSNFVSPFLGGISFTKLRAAQKDEYSWSMPLKDMLGKGCYFVDSAGDRIDANRTFGSYSSVDLRELKNVKVMACDHKDNSGRYTFVDATTKYGAPAKRCSTCGNFCPHDEITSGQDPKCKVCELPIVIETTNLLSEKDIGPWYYTGLDDAMQEILHVHKGRRPTLKLLADTESDCKVEWLTNDYEGITIDLAGHTLTLTGDNNKASYWVTFRNTSTTPAKVVGTVNVCNKSNNPKLVILNTYNDLTIENVKFENGSTAELAGGSFGSITISEDSRAKTLASLLVSGYYFADNTSNKPAPLYDENGNALTALKNVTVKECSHGGVVYNPQTGLYTCPCGQVTYAASVTVGGATTYYKDIQTAFDNADGGTVKPLLRYIDNAVTVSKNVTLDLSGVELASSTFEEFNVTGSLTVFADGSGTDEDINRLALPVVVQNGGALIVPAEYSDGTANCVQLVRSVTVEDGGSVTINGGSVEQAITLEKGSAAVITGGQVSSLALTGVPESVTISGGSFGSIKIYETYSDKTGQLESVWPHTVTYADFASLLKNGLAFKLTSGERWANDSDVESSPPYESARSKALNNVTVADAPIKGVTINGKSSVQYGVDNPLTANVTTTATAGGSSLTYQWYSVDGGIKTAIDGATGASYTLPKQDVDSYAYAVSVDCNGYVRESEPFTVTVEPQRLSLRFELNEASTTKEYDGTADNTGVKVESFYSYPDKSPIPGNTVQYTITDVYYGVEGGRRDPNAADSKNLYGTLSLTDPNYVFYSSGLGPEIGVRTFSMAGKITKAPAPTVQTGTLTVANDQAATYTFDFKSLLPELRVPRTYGEISYGAPAITMNTPYYTLGTAKLAGGVLTLPIQAVQTSEEKTVGTVTVTVTTTNYEDITLTLKVNTVNKKLPVPDGDVALSRSALTYGQTLDTISLSGIMKCGGQTVAGAFVWQEPDAKLNAGNHTAGWVFIPSDTAVYLPVTGKVSITVNKATPSGAPKYTAITANGRTLADAGLTVNGSWPAGTVKWVDKDGNELSDAAEVTANTAYEWLFTPYDTVNYESLRGTLTPYRVSTGGGSSPSYRPDVRDSEGGSTSVSVRNPRKGDAVTITPRPDEGRQVTGISVTDKNGSAVAVRDNGDGTYTFVQPEGAVTIQVTYGPKAEQSLFEDVRPEDYFYDAVKWAAERGITHGVGGGLFGSGDPCTREQIVTFLWRAAGSPVVNYIMPFSDVDEDAWYAEAVRWAASEGIAAGKPDGTFGVGDACTRAQSVTFLFRAMGSHTKPGGSFSDVSADVWYAAAVEWAAARGVTSGIGGGLFAPDNSCTRAQIATFLYRCAE